MTDWIDPERFRLHPAVSHGKRIITNLEDRLKQKRQHWRSWLAEQGVTDPSQTDDFLKKALQLGSIQRRIFKEAAFNQHPEHYEEDAYFEMAATYVAAQYSGKKEHLRQLYTHCVAVISELGIDVGFSPCKTYVPAYRNRVFVHIIPATQKRIDLGLALGDLPTIGNLKDCGGFTKGDRITHKWPLSSEADLDKTCRNWLEKAYQRDAP